MLIRCNPDYYKVFLKVAHPALYALYSAGWENGYTVNGVTA